MITATTTIGGSGNDRLNGLNGRDMSLGGFTRADVNDLNNDDFTGDNDTDDSTTAGNETWVINGKTKMLDEVTVYGDVRLTTLDGKDLTVDMIMLLFDDGSVAFTSGKAVRNADRDLQNNNTNEIDPKQIDYSKGITLGTQRDIEYNSVNKFQRIKDYFVCFTAGTLIRTADGNIPVESLKPGDRVLTLDHGYQEIRWIGAKKLPAVSLMLNPNLRPVRIRKNALGEGQPARDLEVSPQHRIMIRSSIAQRMFGCMEVLVSAKSLLEVDGIEVVEDMAPVEYFHLLFDSHEVIYANGAATESLYTGPEALKSLSAEAREEIFTMFPELSGAFRAGDKPAAIRKICQGKKARQLVSRHLQNNRPIYGPN